MEASGNSDTCEMGSSPSFCAETATPALVWVWSTQPTSGRASCTALWMVNPAGFTEYGVSMTTSPRRFTLTRLLAVISSNSRP